MYHVLITNVGERDIYYNVGTESEPKFCDYASKSAGENLVMEYLQCGRKGGRYISRSILDCLRDSARGYDAYKRIRYPILKTVLAQIIEKQGRIIDKLVLIPTDQPEGTPEEYRSRDSVYSAEVLQEMVQRDYRDKILEIQIIRFNWGSPADSTQAYRFFGEVLPPIVAREALDVQVHVAISGGTPALNDGLRDQALRLYKARCRFYAVAPPNPSEMESGAAVGVLQRVSLRSFIKDLAVSIVEQFLARYDYSGALEVLYTFRSIKFWDDSIDAILNYAKQRVNLNFPEAKMAIEHRIHHEQTDSLQSPMYPAKYSEWYNDIHSPTLLNRIIETYFIAEKRYENNQYADMLWRVAAFYENGLRLVAAKTLGLPQLEDERFPHISFPALQAAHPALHGWLEGDLNNIQGRVKPATTRDPKDQSIRCWQSNIPNLIRFCEYGADTLTENIAWREPFELLRSLSEIYKLRNQVIHHLSGVSTSEINQSFEPPRRIVRENSALQENHQLLIPTLCQIVLSLNRLLGNDADLRNPYEEINRYIEQRLQTSE